jgi:hypothetical protein
VGSAYQGWENSTIYFQQLIPGSGVDELGNPVFQAVEVAVQAYLKQSSRGIYTGKEFRELAGLDQSRVFVSGHLVQPSVYPDGIIFPCTCRVLVQGSEGELHLDSPVVIGIGRQIIESVAGAAISGWLEFVNQLPLVVT